MVTGTGEKLIGKIDHRHILTAGLGVLMASYLAVYLIDIRNIFGLRSLFSEFTVPVVWDFLFRESGLIEVFQWTFLGVFGITSAYIAGNLKNKDGMVRQKKFWSLFAVAGMLMLIEDVGNVRHFLFRWHIALDWNTLNTLETLYFGLIAAVPGYAVLRYGKDIAIDKRIVLMIVAGFLFYGTAVFISGPADITDVNQRIGGTLYDFKVSLGGDELRELYEKGDENIRAQEEAEGVEMMDVRYRIKDYLVEESLELLGVTFLLASSFYYNRAMREGRDMDRIRSDRIPWI